MLEFRKWQVWKCQMYRASEQTSVFIQCWNKTCKTEAKPPVWSEYGVPRNNEIWLARNLNRQWPFVLLAFFTPWCCSLHEAITCWWVESVAFNQVDRLNLWIKLVDVKCIVHWWSVRQGKCNGLNETWAGQYPRPGIS